MTQLNNRADLGMDLTKSMVAKVEFPDMDP